MKTILQYLEANAKNMPNKTIFADSENSITYSQFETQCKKIASSMKILLGG